MQTTDESLVSASPYSLKVNAKYASGVHAYSTAGSTTFDVYISSACSSPVSISVPASSQTNPPNYFFKGAFAGASDSTTFTLNQFTVNPSLCTITYACVSNSGPRTDMCSL